MKRKKKAAHFFKPTGTKAAVLILLFLLLFISFFIIIGKAHRLLIWLPVSEKPKVISGIEITHGDTSKKQIIFTFDGGAGAQSAEKILKTLREHEVKSTFFLTGKFVEQNPDLVKKIIAGKHEIFNHTYNHPFLTELLDEDISKELGDMNRILLAVGGISSKPYFRAPYGARNERVLEKAREAGYQSVYWTVDALDWQESEGMTAEQVKEKIFSNLNPGTIFLMHLGDNITGEVLDDVFSKIENQGYKIVSLTQGL